MKISRCMVSGKAQYCVIDGADVRLLSAPPFEQLVEDGRVLPAKVVTFLPPVSPSKIVAVGLNYRDHAKEFGKAMPEEEPLIFIKPATAIIGNGDDIVYPAMSQRVDYEGELAVVIGKTAKRVSVEQAREHIFGFTIMNDVTARDLQKKDVQYTRSKSFDTFAPIGPWIETVLAPENLFIRTSVNGVVKQDGTTSDMHFSVEQIISFVSQVMTLLPGDVISTGTPPGIGPMNRGDSVEVEVEGIGRLKNRLV